MTQNAFGDGAAQGSRGACSVPPEVIRVAVAGRPLDELLRREWLLTNERGSFASSTIVGCNTSGYHSLLIGSPDPLVSRIMALSTCLETVLWRGQAFELSTFEFAGHLAPAGYGHLREFRRDIGAHFLFHLEPADIRKSVYLARDSDTVVVEYAFEEVRAPVEFILRPFVGMRDFHELQTSEAPLSARVRDGVVTVVHEATPGCILSLGCPALHFESDPHWWLNFVYRVSRQRGLHHREDLWTPGFFKGTVKRPDGVAFWARLHGRDAPGGERMVDTEAIKQNLRLHQETLRRHGRVGLAPPILHLAADQFIAKRDGAAGERTTIVAGFPWFADWGRDTFIALPGLLLATGRHDEAASVLRTFAAAVDGGMIPNRFDDRTGEAHFNSVDASLWFIHAAFEYLDATGDVETLARDLLPAIHAIIESYHRGTRFGIHADTDGLITAGDPDTQLTWMDAKCDGIAFTPRYGKAVEINALWHNALRRMERFCRQAAEGKLEIRNPKSETNPEARNPKFETDAGPAPAFRSLGPLSFEFVSDFGFRISDLPSRYGALAEQVGRSFCRQFWNTERGYLNDLVLPDGSVDESLRPNQIFAVSLPFGPPLRPEHQQAVVAVVERELLTPYGLRTLATWDPAYRGRYDGSPRCRDEAYHQGTVWPYLMGPFVEAWLKVNHGSEASRRGAGEMILPLLEHLVEDGCLGSVSEIFDGDPPHRPGGCHAQAWSVGELLRACHLIAEAGHAPADHPHGF